VVDGHAIREIDLRKQKVRTVCGQVLTPGRPSGDEAVDEALLQPCLNEPWAIVSYQDPKFTVTDTGNHAIRQLDVGPEPHLWTLVGHPDAPGTRWGCAGWPEAGESAAAHATLESPRALLYGEDKESVHWIVSSGPCLGQYREQR
jgi:hypothetical protein